MEYIVDEPHAEIVLGDIWQRYSNGIYPYAEHQTMLPQTHLPEALALGGLEEAWYWMVVCLWMRGGINSTDSAKALSLMYKYLQKRNSLNPFDPFQAAEMTPEQIVELMKEVNLGMHQVAPDWIENARRLIKYWNGDVLHIFKGVSDYDLACERLQHQGDIGAIGFQFKMVSMLLYFLVERGLIEYFAFPPPVDFHLQRVALATQMIRAVTSEQVIARSQTDYWAIEKLLRKLYLDFIISGGHHTNRVTDSLWILSRKLCRYNPGNRTLQISEYRARKTLLQAYEPNWNKPSDLKAITKSCLSCPVQQHCKLNVPSGPRYRLGQTVVLPREEPPNLPLFSPYLQITARPGTL